MKKYLSFFLSGLLLTVLLPFLITVLMAGAGVCNFQKNTPLQDYLPLLLFTQISSNAGDELIKAQAVIARTNFYVQEKKDGSPKKIYKNIVDWFDTIEKKAALGKCYERYKAAADQAREVLTYDGEIRQAPYHTISSGQTRNGAEVLHDALYEYLVSVESPQDIQSPQYLQSFHFSGKDYVDNLKILVSDEAGYVLQVQAGMEIMGGEELRQQLQLPSSAYSFQEIEGNLRILCKGMGHGLGLSQYGAGFMEEQGSNYIEILQYYYPKMEVSADSPWIHGE